MLPFSQTQCGAAQNGRTVRALKPSPASFSQMHSLHSLCLQARPRARSGFGSLMCIRSMTPFHHRTDNLPLRFSLRQRGASSQTGRHEVHETVDRSLLGAFVVSRRRMGMHGSAEKPAGRYMHPSLLVLREVGSGGMDAGRSVGCSQRQ